MKIAIIFVGGSGSRLHPLTKKTHKSLIKFQGLPLIEHTINKLLQVPKLNKIIVITGYLQQDFSYLANKYHNLTLINNDHYLDYNSGYALKLVSMYFNGANDIFIIAGDMVSTKNHFLNDLSTNVMTAITRNEDNIKKDWSYKLDRNNNIIDIVKSNKKNSLLAGEWTYVTKEWAKILGQDLANHEQELVLQTTMVGKYLINNSISHHIELKSYILDANTHWDLDDINDLERTNEYFK